MSYVEGRMWPCRPQAKTLAIRSSSDVPVACLRSVKTIGNAGWNHEGSRLKSVTCSLHQRESDVRCRRGGLKRRQAGAWVHGGFRKQLPASCASGQETPMKGYRGRRRTTSTRQPRYLSPDGRCPTGGHRSPVAPTGREERYPCLFTNAAAACPLCIHELSAQLVPFLFS